MSDRASLTQTTHVPTDDAKKDVSAIDADVIVLAWSSSEPERSGEVAMPAAVGRPSILGRGDAETADEPRLRFFRQRPGVLEPSDPLRSLRLSRRQLLFRPTADGLVAERVGRGELRVNGRACDVATLRPGDVLVLGNDLVLYCARRSTRLAPTRHFAAQDAPSFGRADAHGIIGESAAIWALRDALAFAAKAHTHVLLVGPSGSGKELAARAIHGRASTSRRPFVSRSAATLPPGLVDAELFGNARNYPNPGMAERAGLVGEADGGTLFLDEIGELSFELQSHLLRVLDRDGEYQRLGESTVRHSRFRLVAATNRDRSALKHDLLARFATTVELPSIDARREDILQLARALVLRAAQRSPDVVNRFVTESGARAEMKLDSAFAGHLLRHTFPANVRDLDTLLWRAIASSSGDVLELPSVGTTGPASEVDAAPAEIRAALAAAKGNITRAARALGLPSRYALYRLMKKHDIEGVDL